MGPCVGHRHLSSCIKLRVNTKRWGGRAISAISLGSGQVNSPIDYVCQGVQRGEGGQRPKIEGNTLWPGCQSSIPGGVGGVTKRNKQGEPPMLPRSQGRTTN